MAVTVAVEHTKWRPGQFDIFGTLNLGTYVTGGPAITPGLFGLSRIEELEIAPAGGYTFQFDKANLKIKAFAAVQIVHNATPAAQPVNVTTADTGLEADFGATVNFAGPEALNAANLSAVTTRFKASGY